MQTTETPTYSPVHLNRWTRPGSYFGAEWPEYFVFLARNRDSDTLTESNFQCGLEAIGGEVGAIETSEGEVYPVTVVRESHWACGWVEWIAIHESNAAALRIADQIADKLESYPVVNEDHWSELEQTEADKVWKDCYSTQERIDYMRRYSSQFEFWDFSAMLSCARGKYFAGYASELLN